MWGFWSAALPFVINVFVTKSFTKIGCFLTDLIGRFEVGARTYTPTVISNMLARMVLLVRIGGHEFDDDEHNIVDDDEHGEVVDDDDDEWPDVVGSGLQHFGADLGDFGLSSAATLIILILLMMMVLTMVMIALIMTMQALHVTICTHLPDLKIWPDLPVQMF